MSSTLQQQLTADLTVSQLHDIVMAESKIRFAYSLGDASTTDLQESAKRLCKINSELDGVELPSFLYKELQSLIVSYPANVVRSAAEELYGKPWNELQAEWESKHIDEIRSRAAEAEALIQQAIPQAKVLVTDLTKPSEVAELFSLLLRECQWRECVEQMRRASEVNATSFSQFWFAVEKCLEQMDQSNPVPVNSEGCSVSLDKRFCALMTLYMADMDLQEAMNANGNSDGSTAQPSNNDSQATPRSYQSMEVRQGRAGIHPSTLLN